MKNFLKAIKIGNLNIYPNIFLAPMAGITNKFFREIIISLSGCGLTFSELISSEAIIRNRKVSFEMMERASNEKIFAVQIYGYKPESMGEAAKIIEGEGLAEIIDINCGCPARKVVKHGAGSGLLKDLSLFEKIIDTVIKSVSLPVTVKMRSGFNEPVFLKAGKIAEELGVKWITLHPRLRSEMFSGKSRWEYIKELKESVDILVIGNGDIFSPLDGYRMFEKTGCDGVMIGRGITKNPFIIYELFKYLKGEEFEERRVKEKLAILLKLLWKIDKNLPLKAKTGEMKRFSTFFIHGFDGAANLRRYIYQQKEPTKILEFIEKLYNEYEVFYEEKNSNSPFKN